MRKSHTMRTHASSNFHYKLLAMSCLMSQNQDWPTISALFISCSSCGTPHLCQLS
ncbi:unnamed protein product [Periconia digitata]|uniref:Uncharacterized protein n=1 Tax=Periconia digitata TaxID=1303443 RepID=A0A9W4UDN8_9PLEO|nr:unnamed protein product [Periconia digitata]